MSFLSDIVFSILEARKSVTVEVTAETGAICVSRPTNPTGNVVTDEELARLEAMARQHDIPLIVDGAYGTPFPNLLFVDATPHWNDQVILCLSLSKFGLPAVRTGIVIAAEPVIKALSGINAIMNLATGSFGAMLAEPLVRSGEILSLSRDVVCPFYKAKMERAVAVSSSPVGSSANTTSGCVTSALAIDTRCCSPPDSSKGRCRARVPSPTAFRASLARWRRSRQDRPPMCSGNSTFSWADNRGMSPND